MSEFFVENNLHVSGNACVAVELFFLCENYKMGANSCFQCLTGVYLLKCLVYQDIIRQLMGI